VQSTSLRAGSRERVTPGRDHLRVAQDRTATLERSGRLLAEVRRGGDIARQVDHPAGVDHPHHDPLEHWVEPVEIGLGADRGERPAVDLGAVADVAHPGAPQLRSQAA